MIFTEKQAEKRVDDFIESVVHDLKTPTLAQIRAIDLLLNNKFGELNEIQQEVLLQVQNSCKYMNDLIYSILDSCTNDDTNIILNYEKFDIEILINQIINEVKNLADDKNKNIILNMQLKDKFCMADKLQIKRVIMNLLVNAINYGLSGTKITLSVENLNGSFRFFVKNKSKYLTEDKIKALFLKYKSTNFDNNIASNGLGLYLSKQIIERHDGKVFALSYPNKTCIFGFEIKNNPFQ